MRQSGVSCCTNCAQKIANEGEKALTDVMLFVTENCYLFCRLEM